MNIQNIEKKEKNMATFEVKVPADVFDNAVNEAYKKNKNHLYVAGFRKGKAPRAVIEGMYGKEVFYPDAIEAQGRRRDAQCPEAQRPPARC